MEIPTTTATNSELNALQRRAEDALTIAYQEHDPEPLNRVILAYAWYYRRQLVSQEDIQEFRNELLFEVLRRVERHHFAKDIARDLVTMAKRKAFDINQASEKHRELTVAIEEQDQESFACAADLSGVEVLELLNTVRTGNERLYTALIGYARGGLEGAHEALTARYGTITRNNASVTLSRAREALTNAISAQKEREAS